MAGPTREIPWRRTTLGGMVSGLAAGMAMAGWTMLASVTWEGAGVFTPLYVIASPIAGRDEVTRSLVEGGAYWATGPALLGLGLHLFTAVVLAGIFAATAALLGTRRWSGLALGIGFSLLVLVVMTSVVLPMVDAVRMQRVLSWGTWTAAHLVFGGVLGAWPFARPDDVTVAEHDPTDLWETV